MKHPYSCEGKPPSERFAGFLSKVERVNHFSQYGEDGLLEAIFAKIGTTNKHAAECGASDGLFFSNTRYLILQGWSATLIEPDEFSFQKLTKLYEKEIQEGRVKCLQRLAGTAPGHRLDDYLNEAAAPEELDLLIIDVDGSDYYLFNSLLKFRPRVVVVEYDPKVDRMFIPDMGTTDQAGIDAIAYVGRSKGYEALCATQGNLILVRHDLLDPLEGEPPPRLIHLAAAMSTPRLGFMANTDSLYAALAPLGAALFRGEGAFWHHSLSRSIQSALEAGADYVLTIDYDTLFRTDDVKRLVCLLEDNPDVDVVVAMQQKREGGELLATSAGPVTITDPLVPIVEAHFGLTLFRASVFTDIDKPWFYEKPNESGDWGEGRIDADIGFWKNLQENGIKVCQATDVVIGHLELVATWPDMNRVGVYQPVTAYRREGSVKPAFAFDREKLASLAAQNGHGALTMKG